MTLLPSEEVRIKVRINIVESTCDAPVVLQIAGHGKRRQQLDCKVRKRRRVRAST